MTPEEMQARILYRDGVIELPLGRRDASRGWWMKPDPEGVPAVTTWKVLGRCMSAASNTEEPVSVGVVGGDPSEPSKQLPSPLRGRVGEGGEPSNSQARDLPPGERGAATSPSREKVKNTGATSRGKVFNSTSGGPQAVGKKLTWLALAPLTGRTHQLRVHCAAMGWPILGDAIYGAAPRHGGPGLHLHAREILVPLSKNRDPVRVTAPVPAHMQNLLRACGLLGE